MKFTSLIGVLLNSRLFKDSSLYTIFNFAEKIIPFAILPIITRYLSVESVGFYVLYQAIVNILLPLLTLNIDSSILLNYYKVTNEQFKKYFSSGFVFFVTYSIIILLLLLPFSSFISERVNFPQKWLVIIVVLILFEFFSLLRKNLWRVKREVKNYGFFSLGIVLINNSIGLTLLFTTDLDWKAIVLGHLTGYFIFAVYAIITFFKENLIQKELNISYLKDMINIGYPISLHKIGLWLSNSANRIIINSVLGATATGNYGIGATFGVIVHVFTESFNKAFSPYLFEKLSRVKTDLKKIVKITYMAYGAMLLFAIIMYVIGYFGVGIIFGDSYLITRKFILPLVLAAIFKGFYTLHVNYIFFTKRTLKITQITLTTGVINVFLAYILIQQFGLVGAAYSMLIVSFLQYVLAFYYGNKLISMPWKECLRNPFSII